jgi:hypothetical protein
LPFFYLFRAVSDCGILVIYDAAVADEKLARELLELSQNTQTFRIDIQYYYIRYGTLSSIYTVLLYILLILTQLRKVTESAR